MLVVGTGTWGTALAATLARHGPVALLCRSREERAALEAARRNPRFLPQVAFPPPLRLLDDPAEACAAAELVLLLVPSHRMRENVRRIAPHLGAHHIVLSGAKGLEADTLRRMTEVARDELPPDRPTHIGALSGPNLAGEIAEGRPASSVVALHDGAALARALAALNTHRFRVYGSADIVGIELGGALKNVIALGAGACDGLGAGENAKATFVTRGLAEIARLGVAAGANPLTFAGLAGLGDLLATVSSGGSRNRRVGEELARGRPLPMILDALTPQIAEGVETTRHARGLARRYGVEMPITEETYAVLFDGRPVDAALRALMERDPRHELDDMPLLHSARAPGSSAPRRRVVARGRRIRP